MEDYPDGLWWFDRYCQAFDSGEITLARFTQGLERIAEWLDEGNAPISKTFGNTWFRIEIINARSLSEEREPTDSEFVEMHESLRALRALLEGPRDMDFMIGELSMTAHFAGDLQLLRGVVAPLTLSVQGRTILKVMQFPVIELCQWLRAWIDDGCGEEFVFDSRGSLGKGVLEYQRTHGEMGSVKSALTGLDATREVGWELIVSKSKQYVEEIDRRFRDFSGLDLVEELGGRE